jgi:hypothetical protein
MKRGVLLLSGLLVILSGAAIVHWAAGFPAILPWPILLVFLASGAGGLVLILLRDQSKDNVKQSPTPATPGAPATSTSRITKKHRPRARAKKRVIRNSFKRRTRKAGATVLSHDADIAHPGEHQVGFFG